MKFTVNNKKVMQALEKMEKKASELDRVMVKLSLLVVASIKKRVIENGQGLHGKMDYKSLQYALKRKEKGRQVGHKDLLFSGRMWRALMQEVQDTGSTIKAKLFFGSVEENKKAMGNDNRDAFFGIGPDEEKVIDQAQKELLKGMF